MRPFRRRHDRHISDDEVTARLRAGLAEQAREAPSGDAVADRVIARAHNRGEIPAGEPVSGVWRRPADPHRTPGWRRRGPLLAAAAAIVALVAGVVTAVAVSGQEQNHREAADPSPSAPTSSAPTSTAPRSTSAAPRPAMSTTPSYIPPTGSNVVHVPTLSSVIVDAATFTGADSGWALASATCLSSSGRCSALLRTTDGHTWQSHPNTPFNVPGVNGCGDPCVRAIRFATDHIGYAFGPSALYLTTDGAQSWHRLPGGADALETLRGTVIRVSHTGDCPPGCRYTVQTALIGKTHWVTRTLPGPAGDGNGVTLTRTGDAAFLQVYGNPAGGADGRSVLWTSSDDGGDWHNRGEPCTQRDEEVDGRALTSAADGSATVLCRGRKSGRQFVTVTTNGGKSFRAGASVLGAGQAAAPGAASATTIVVSISDTFRTTDGGQHFARTGANGRSTPGDPSYIGFASDRVGHAISSDGHVIWTTRDAGKTWTKVSFG